MEIAVIRRVGFKVKRKLETVKALIPKPKRDLEDFIAEIGVDDPASLLDSFPQILPGCSSQENMEQLREQYGEACQRVIDRAKAHREHRFDLLGSGEIDLGIKIDWLWDFKSGKRWDKRHFRLQKIVDLEDHSDVKVPWELSRCNHFLPMAIACLLTDHQGYADEYENQIVSWCDDNEYEHSVNWTCAMETAIRCINWLLAYKLFSLRHPFSLDFKTRLIAELYKGGKHIRGNLEKTGLGYNTNHYVSDLVGLLYLGELFRKTRRGKGWRKFAIRELEREIMSQVDGEGLDYESSLPYHGLVTELFLYSHILAFHSDFTFSETFNDRLKKMIVNLSRFTNAHGLVIPFGDGDDGRLIKIFDRHPRDFRDVIAIGERLLGIGHESIEERDEPESCLFACAGRNPFLPEKQSGKVRQERIPDGAMNWIPASETVEKPSFEGFFVGRVPSEAERNEKPDKGLSAFSVPPDGTPEADLQRFSAVPSAGMTCQERVSDGAPVESGSFYLRSSGICKLRSRDIDLTFFANPVGSAGLGNHKHNDILSFTLDYQGRSIFVDPGTYVYTADKRWRNFFRGTAGHNTVLVDRCEQNRLVKDRLFLLRNDSKPRVVLWKSDNESDLVVAETDSYSRLPDPVLHRRSLYLDKQTSVVLIRDELVGNEPHHLEFNFQLDNLKLEMIQDNLIRFMPDGMTDGVIFAACDPIIGFAISTNWISPSYGVKYAGLRLSGEVTCQLPVTMLFAILPFKNSDRENALERIIQARQVMRW